jgi:hypothetical protein
VRNCDALAFVAAAKVSSSAAATLLILCLYANGNRRAWPALASIAQARKVTERQVRSSMRDLEDAGLIECVEPGGGRKRAAVYRIADMAAPKSQKPGHHRSVNCGKPRSALPVNEHKKQGSPLPGIAQRNPEIEASKPGSKGLQTRKSTSAEVKDLEVNNYEHARANRTPINGKRWRAVLLDPNTTLKPPFKKTGGTSTPTTDEPPVDPEAAPLTPATRTKSSAMPAPTRDDTGAATHKLATSSAEPDPSELERRRQDQLARLNALSASTRFSDAEKGGRGNGVA